MFEGNPKPPLDFNVAMHGLIEEIVCVLPQFSGLDCQKIRISTTVGRVRSRAGLLAYVLPLKYKNGSPIEHRVRRGRLYTFAMFPFVDHGTEVLYIIYFVMPRFMNLSWRDKLETIVHELYHISPFCDGDLRRLKGRSYLHGNSVKEYDALMNKLTDQFLESPHDASKYAFLKGTYSRIEKKYGQILTTHIKEPKPKLLKVSRVREEKRQLELL